MQNKVILKPWLVWTIVIASFVGVLETLYLDLKFFQGKAPKCSVIEGCDQVLTSSYAEVFGLPVSLYGTIAYLAVFLLMLVHKDTKSRFLAASIAVLTTIGFSVSLLLLYIMAFEIQAYCTYCLLSLVLWTIMFASSLFIFRELKSVDNQSHPHTL